MVTHLEVAAVVSGGVGEPGEEGNDKGSGGLRAGTEGGLAFGHKQES